MTTTPNTTKVVTGKVRLSYVALLEPKAFEGQEAKYSTVILIPKTDKVTIKKIKDAQKAAYEAAKDNKLKGVKWERVKTTLRDGDEEMDTEEHPEYTGHMFMSVSSKLNLKSLISIKILLIPQKKSTPASMPVYHLMLTLITQLATKVSLAD
ncbi:PF10991 domain protein [Streptococcus pyogenes GA06023]|nr:PF10991 domain protein [Streptococcus pyogenes GA06023]